MAGTDDQRSDLELIATVKGGDWAAFDALYFRHKDRVFRLAWRFCSDESEALDVLQEVFVYLAGKLRGDFVLTSGLTTFLYPAVKHCALALKKKRRRMAARGGDETLEIETRAAPPEPREPFEHRAELAQVLRALTDAHREIILMRFVDDMTVEEIATALAIPLGTAKSRLHHALAALREDPRLERWFLP